MVDNPTIGRALATLQAMSPQTSDDSPLSTIELDIPDDAKLQHTLKEIQERDLMISNNNLKMLYAYIPQIKSITSLCRLIDTSMNIVEKRRKQLCMPYGFESKNGSSNFLDPDD